MKPQAMFAVILTAPLFFLGGCVSMSDMPVRTDWNCRPLNNIGVKMTLKKARLICSGASAKHQKLGKSQTCTTNIYDGGFGLSGTQNCRDDLTSIMLEGAEKDNVFLACMAEKNWECEPVYQVFDTATGRFVDYEPEQQ